MLNKLLYFFSKHNNTLLIKFLLKIGADVHYRYDVVLCHAIINKNIELIKYLNSDKKDILRYTIKYSDFDMVKIIVEIFNIQQFDKHLLCDACKINDYDIANYLIKYGCDVNIVTSYDIMFRIIKRDINIVKLLLANGYDINNFKNEEFRNIMIDLKNEIRKDKINEIFN